MAQRVLCPLLQFLEDLIYFFESQIVVVCVIHLHGRRIAAGSQALDFSQRKLSVAGRLAFFDAKSFGHVLKDLLTAKQQTGDVGTDLNVMFSNWFPSQHAVEGDDFINLDLG